ncbi:MAG: hypothetical protein B6I28_03960 [Fusobacteriia bacterium 4572_132]|nr:MAG: hypothetical protein B6I28_03960 [Fusobacteriia bacterium 4572_132]
MDVTEIKKLMKILDTTDVTEINLESDGTEISLKKDRNIANRMREASIKKENTEVEPVVETKKLLSLNVGKVQLLPEMKIGRRIKEDEVVGFIESIGIKTEVKSDVEGIIKEIYVENGEIADFGKVLMEIEEK